MRSGQKQLLAKIIPILKKYKVKRASLFGSYVRGENKKTSDLDLLVELGKGKSLLDLIRLERQLEETLGFKVDLLTYNSLSPLLKEIILKEQIQIFSQGKTLPI